MSLSIHSMGGLGNRMFQLASAYAISKKLDKTFVVGMNLILPNSHQTTTSADYIFSPFECVQEFRANYLIQEGEYEFRMMPLPTSLEGNIGLHGYFQTEDYFYEYADQIRSWFTPPTRCVWSSPLEQACFLHVRRGDFVGHFLHELPLEDYYRRALALMIKERPTLNKILICSDDIQWCRSASFLDGSTKDEPKFERSSNATFVEFVEGKDEVETLSLMTQCGYGGICPNSTFSWWGVWLNPSKEKLMIFPHKIINSSHRFDRYFPRNSIVLSIF